jgi:hypothetical protein
MEMGLKSFIDIGLSHLGMRQILVSLRLEGKYPIFYQEDAAPKISSPQCS